VCGHGIRRDCRPADGCAARAQASPRQDERSRASLSCPWKEAWTKSATFYPAAEAAAPDQSTRPCSDAANQSDPSTHGFRDCNPWQGGGASVSIAGFRHSLLAIDRSALPRRRGQASVGRDLLSVGETSVEPLRPEDGGELGTDAFDGVQHRLWRQRSFGLRRWLEQGVPLGLDGLDLFNQQLNSMELAADLSLEMRRQRTPIARLQLVEPLASIATQRLVVRYALGEQQSLDPVNVLDSF